MGSYDDRVGELYDEIDDLKGDKVRLLSALEAIGSMHIGEDTDFQQLHAICAAVALTTIKEMQS